jgi:transcriptional regulator with XRE-family HTH domain
MDENFIEWKDVKKEITILDESEKENINIMAQLEHVLIESGYTQTELANITGLKQPAISRLLNRVEYPRVDTLLNLLLPLGYTLQVVKKEDNVQE